MSKAKAVETALVNTDFYNSLPFWNELSQAEQKTVVHGTEKFKHGFQQAIQSRLEMAEGLYEASMPLKEKGYWVKYLQSLKQNWRTSYRWWNRFSELKEDGLPQAVIDRAKVRHIDLIDGEYVAPMKQLPAPSVNDADDPTVDAYLDKVVEMRTTQKSARRTRRRAVDPHQASVRAWRAVISQWDALAGHSTAKARAAWVVRLIGAIMTKTGLPAQRFEPEAIPGDYEPKVGYPAGRPRKALSQRKKRVRQAVPIGT
jgi:hypothetical protein